MSARFGIDAVRFVHDQLPPASQGLPRRLGPMLSQCELVLPNHRFVALRAAHRGMK